MDPIKKLLSATCITYCIKMPSTTMNVLFMTHDPEIFLLPLASMLILHPDKDVKFEYEHICSMIPDELRYTVRGNVVLIKFQAIIPYLQNCSC